MKFLILCSTLFLLCQTAWGLQLPFGRNYFFDSSHSSTQKIIEEPDIFVPEISNSSEYLTGNESAQTLLREETSVSTSQNSSAESTTDDQSSTNSTSSSSDATTGTQTSASAFGNESQPQNLSLLTASVSYDGAIESINSSETSNITASSPSNEWNEDDGGGVARGKPSTTESSITTTTTPQSLYQKTWAMISDTYTLSILVPVAAGVVFATTIILTLACCRCLRRCCIRRRMRKKVLPDSVKNLSPSDRARLLAESSDDEF